MDENRTRTRRTVYVRFISGLIIMALMLFLPAGSLSYWQAWLYCCIIFLPILFVLSYLLKHDPELLERRMRMREKEGEQKAIVKLSAVIFLFGFIIPGLDFRFGWSDVPVAVVFAADAIVLAGYLLIFLTFRENSYASRVVEVEKGQRVITTGPYALIRHPMYLGMLLMFLATPFALGSYWALIAFLPLPLFLAFTIVNEEEVLARELPGYEDYRRKTRYRLIPFLW